MLPSSIQKVRVLMVCLGNICRSPLAEGVFSYEAQRAGLPCEVDSAGTGSWHLGSPPHPLSCQVARENGIDISHQRARQFEPADLESFDHIFFMDKNNLRDARQMAGKLWQPAKTKLLLEDVPGGLPNEVPDPYYGQLEDYHYVFNLITKACRYHIRKMLSEDKP